MLLVSLALKRKLNTLWSKFFTTSGTHIFAYGSLIILQLPLHLLVLILTEQNVGSSLLPLRIYDLILHSSLFIEAHFQGVALSVITLKNDIATIIFF